jgi:hypothetical protein
VEMLGRVATVSSSDRQDNTGWGYYMQGSDQQIEIEEIGAKLSSVLHCPVHYPAWGKRMFECGCNITFPVFALSVALHNDNWAPIIEHHNSLVS